MVINCPNIVTTIYSIIAGLMVFNFMNNESITDLIKGESIVDARTELRESKKGNMLMEIDNVEAFQLSISNLVMQKIFMNLLFLIIIGLIAWGMRKLIQGVISGPMNMVMMSLVNRVTMVCIASIIVLVIFAPINAMKKELKFRSYPNQGIYKSLQNQMLISIIIFFPIILLFIQHSYLQYWQLGIFIALLFGFIIGGGKACLQHLSLRIVLWQSGLPWNFARFLNYCVERRLLLRVGGSYRFLHRELLDHFAQSNR